MAPSVPGFASGLGSDTAQIGAVIPSHKNDRRHAVAVVDLERLAEELPARHATARSRSSRPRPTPGRARRRRRRPSSERAASRMNRRPNDPRSRRSASRSGTPRACSASRTRSRTSRRTRRRSVPSRRRRRRSRVWPGRKMVWGSGTNVPRTRNDFLCPGGTCPNGAVTAMGLTTSGRRRAQGEAHGRLPARRHDDQRQPRRGPQSAERRAAGSPGRAERRRSAEVLLLLPGRHSASGHARRRSRRTARRARRATPTSSATSSTPSR